MRCLIIFMINLSPVQLKADVGELEQLPVQETPLYHLEELQDRLKDIQVHLAKMQDQIGMVSQRLVKIQNNLCTLNIFLLCSSWNIWHKRD